MEELKGWRKRIGLTSLTSDHEIIIKHFIDSLSPMVLIPPSSFLVDLGSGAGFPGIPLKIAQPSTQVALIDSSLKKIHFQKHIIRRLNLTGIKSFHHRAENGPIKKLGINRGEIVISRALSKVERSILLAVPYLKEDGRLILMLGKNPFLKQIKKISISLGMEIEKTLPFQLPRLGHQRYLFSLIFKKKTD
jgi:16S rRNA (guanine527-N7)-methyltransferase